MAIIGIGIYFIIKNKSSKEVQVTTQSEAPLYSNTNYGFDFSLTVSWKGYSIIEDKWTGQMLDAQDRAELSAQIEGPKIIIRHPLWTEEVPRQDIPIMIFNLTQWNLIQQEKLSVGAAPIGPSELGRNKDYVFALPARYNFAYPIGFEEVQQIIESKALHTF